MMDTSSFSGAICWRYLLSLCIVLDAAVGWLSSTPYPAISAAHESSLQPKLVQGLFAEIQRGDFASNGRLATLADKYVIETKSSETKYIWSLFPIARIVEGMDIIAEGEMAKQALLATATLPAMAPTLFLECDVEDSCEIRASSRLVDEGQVDTNVQELLIRILVQWAAGESPIESDNWTVILDIHGEPGGPISMDISSNVGLQDLFQDSYDMGSKFEWVEMVTGEGKVLGKLPRPLVHSYNVLHRGIGLFVTKDRPMLQDVAKLSGAPTSDSFPDLYTHRRTDTKRIFPSLYDMFFGGVSVANEDSELTARREVAEELGLSNALLPGNSAMSEPILECLVCTSYNRCLVTLFSYTVDTNVESVMWQEEEVAWGDFVPYPTIAAAGDLSIQRLARSQAWPGSYPPVQSAWNGSLESPPGQSYNKYDWTQWDFVPDGLLVWDAWLIWLESKRKAQ